MNKQTPKNWEKLTLNDISEIYSGGTPDTNHIEYWNGEINWITPTEITKTGKYITIETEKKITTLGLKNSSAKLMKENTLILCSRATIGECSISTFPICTNQGFKNLVPNNKTSVEYLYYYIKSNKSKLLKLSSGSTFLEISKTDIAKIKINLPPLPEQEKIIKVLEVFDEYLEKISIYLNTKREIKAGLTLKLLTKKLRLSGFNFEWQNLRLGDVTKRIRRRNTEDNTNVLTISAKHGLVSQEEYFKRKIASENLSNYLLLYRNDFAYNKSYSKGYPMGVIKKLKLYDKGVVSSLYFSFIPMQNINSHYLEFYFESGLFNKEISKTAQEGARNHGLLNISYDDFMNGDIHIPAIEEQTAIANILTKADQEIEALEKKKAIIEQQKKYLLNMLITGQIRFSEFTK